MKVIFIGVHNKVDKEPLCSSTKSGKLIDRIIEKLKPIKCIKTNLYDLDYMPNEEDKFDLAMEWHKRINPKLGDVVVLLGAEVNKNYILNMFDKIVKIHHPASKRSHIEMDEYVLDTVEEIKKQIEN